MSDSVQMAIVIIGLVVVHTAVAALAIRGMRRASQEHNARMERLLQAQLEEKKDLMDRIQAPSFHEYTNKVVREKRAEKPEEKQPPVEFIS